MVKAVSFLVCPGFGVEAPDFRGCGKNAVKIRFREGHDFSRAVYGRRMFRALAPEVIVRCKQQAYLSG